VSGAEAMNSAFSKGGEERRMSEEVEEEFASTAQIRKLYAVLHSLGISPKEFKQQKGFSSYSKLGRFEISEMIEELEDREERVKAQENQQASTEEGAAPEEAKADLFDFSLAEVNELGILLQSCVRAASETLEAIPDDIYGEVSEESLLDFISKLAVTMFIQVSRRR